MTEETRAATPFGGRCARRHFDAGRRRVDGGARADEVDSRWQPPETIAAAARAAAVAAGRRRRRSRRNRRAAQAEPLRYAARCEGRARDRARQRHDRRELQRADRWRLFVPVRARNDVAVLVLARNVQPGEVLTAADVAVARRSSTSLPYDYLSDGAQAVGLDDAPHATRRRRHHGRRARGARGRAARRARHVDERRRADHASSPRASPSSRRASSSGSRCAAPRGA